MNDQNVSLPEYLGITEAAEYLRVSASTLRRWEKKGFLIPERTPTGIRRYTKQQLDAVLQQGPPQFSTDDSITPTYPDIPSNTSTDYSVQSTAHYSYESTEVQPLEETSSYFTETEASSVATTANDTPIPTENSSFISSHRYSPPPTYAPPPPPIAQQAPLPRAEEAHYENDFAFSSVRVPEDDVQSALNNLSSSHEEFAYTPVHHQPATKYQEPTQSLGESRSSLPQYNYPIPQPVSHYDEPRQHDQDFSFEESTDEEFVPVREQTESVALPNKSSKKASTHQGIAMFIGVFVGLLIITAGIWFGYLYFSGNLGTAALLRPIP